MTTTGTDALIEKIARAAFNSDGAHSGLTPRTWESQLDAVRKEYRDLAADILPIVAVEVRKAKAEAWDEGVTVGARDSFSADLTPNPYRETGDSDEHR